MFVAKGQTFIFLFDFVPAALSQLFKLICAAVNHQTSPGQRGRSCQLSPSLRRFLKINNILLITEEILVLLDRVKMTGDPRDPSLILKSINNLNRVPETNRNRGDLPEQPPGRTGPSACPRPARPFGPAPCCVHAVRSGPGSRPASGSGRGTIRVRAAAAGRRRRSGGGAASGRRTAEPASGTEPKLLRSPALHPSEPSAVLRSPGRNLALPALFGEHV